MSIKTLRNFSLTQFFTFDTHVDTHLGTCTRIMSYVVRTMCVSNAYQMHSLTRYAHVNMVRTVRIGTHWYAYLYGTHWNLYYSYHDNS